MPSLRAGQRVIIVRRALSDAKDAYGNDSYSDQEIIVDGCAISPVFSTENVQGTQTTETNITIHMPDGTVVYATDALKTPEGRTYEVVGIPNTWKSPFTGTTSMVEVKVREVTGA